MNEVFEIFKRHDKYQFEMKFNYSVAPYQSLSEYNVDTYIFLPANLDINSSTYKPEDFYTDVRDYIRLKTPEFQLSMISKDVNSPIIKLKNSITELSATGSAENLQCYTKRIKMFCSIMKSALRDEEFILEQKLPTGENANKEKVREYLLESQTALLAFRKLEEILHSPNVSDPARKLFRHGDEFLSITINKYRYKLYFALNEDKLPWGAEFKKKVLTAIKNELVYRKKCEYPSVPSLRGDNEDIVYREGVLKKAMASVLFLKTDTRKDGVLLENFIFGIAAGFAMTFATLIAYFTQSLFMKEFSIFFLFIVVFAYMGKDRIKELLRVYLHAKARRFMYDFKTTIYDSLDNPIGFSKENFHFVSESKVPEKIQQIRNRAYLSHLENGCFGEKVILSRRRVKLNSGIRREFSGDFDITGVVDIMRFNIRKFLMKMDNPVRPVFLPDEKESVAVVDGKRVYHVNIVIRYGMEGHTDHYVRYRLVLSRSGIVRINFIPAPELDSPTWQPNFPE